MNDNNINLFPNYLMYGHAYVPDQKMRETFKPKDGLNNGTIFPELVSPYAPCQSMRVIGVLSNDGGTYYG